MQDKISPRKTISLATTYVMAFYDHLITWIWCTLGLINYQFDLSTFSEWKQLFHLSSFLLSCIKIDISWTLTMVVVINDLEYVKCDLERA